MKTRDLPPEPYKTPVRRSKQMKKNMWESMGKHKVGLVEYFGWLHADFPHLCWECILCVCVFFTSLFNQNTKKSYLVINLPTKNFSQYFRPHAYKMWKSVLFPHHVRCNHYHRVICWRWDLFGGVGGWILGYTWSRKTGSPNRRGTPPKDGWFQNQMSFFCFKPKNPDPSNVT